MKLALAMQSHEVCTFNPDPTTLADFDARFLRYGAELIDQPPPQAGFVKGFLDRLHELEPAVALVPTVGARTTAGGRIDAATLAHLRAAIVDPLVDAGPLDAVAMCLHGASAAEGVDDVEGHLLEAVREVVGDEVPIGVVLDHHGNITAKMVELATVIIGDRYQPHVKHETGGLLADLLVNVVRGDVDPVMVWRKLPLISHQEQYLTSKPPMKTWFDAARAHEQADSPVISASNFPMQPWMDVAEAGYATVVIADGNQPGARQAADAAADNLAEVAWSLRADFQIKDSVSPAEAVEISAATDALTVISDTGNSVGGGSGGDSIVMLQAFLAHGGPRALIPLVHPPIADLVDSLEVGQTVTLAVGGAVTGWWEPIEVTGTVFAVDPDYTAPDMDAVRHMTSSTPLPYQNSRYCGATVALEIDNVMLVISQMPGPAGRAPIHYSGLGIDVSTYDAAVLKTASNFQFWTEDLTTNLVRADTPGPTQSDMASLPWQRIPRPIYPLDLGMTGWKDAG